MKVVLLVATVIVGVFALLWTLAMVGFLVWDIARGRWVNVPLDVLFGIVSAFCVRACLRYRRRLTTI